ncbi:MAG: hypothetical protein VSS75_004820 [Candidatus Parabeggiatoa sp.]|nr:hypothetical protein [Candidatus Parabeggiatoa sp.]
MEWHIITSSKGGVGKTLLTMLLAARNIEIGKTTLVIDLNAMNADSSALLIEGIKDEGVLDEKIIVAHANANKITEQLGAENIIIHKLYSCLQTKEGKKTITKEIPSAVGWPSNPFGLYKPTIFADFICTIKEAINTRIKDELGLEIESVIIDTNYHFCNIFAQDAGQEPGQQIDYYQKYKEQLGDDNITVWFLWVYRQLDSLIRGKEDKILLSASQIERHFSRQNDDIFSPIMHVVTPISLLTSQALPQDDKKEDEEDSFYYRLRNALRSQKNEKNICVDGLENADLLPRGNYKPFREWVRELAALRRELRVSGDEREHEGDIFLSLLRQAIKNERPMNVIPLWDYHIELQRYTDKFSTDPLFSIRKYEIYTTFKKLLEKTPHK